MGHWNGYPSLYDKLTSGEIHLAVVIPPQFETELDSGKRAAVQVIIDGSDAITARQGLARFEQRTRVFEQQLASAGEMQAAPIVVRSQVWYNRDLKSTFAMVPGLIPIVLILPSLAVALAVTREKELGSFETLAATPIRAAEYLLGKLTPYVVFGIVSAAIAVVVAIGWFGVPLRGSPIDLLLTSTFYLFASLGESLFISSLLVSQGTAMRVILLLFFVPSFFLTGVTLPVDTGSGPGQLASYFLPVTYFVQVTRGIFLKEMGLSQLASQSLYLLLLGAVSFVLSILVFRKQVD
jgi:ABC-2 type transport system permease protein